VTDIRWSYSAELRDTGTVSAVHPVPSHHPTRWDASGPANYALTPPQYGFLLPPSLIRPAAEETTAGLMYLARFIYNAEIAG
jgi:extracellular matrix protein 14